MWTYSDALVLKEKLGHANDTDLEKENRRLKLEIEELKCRLGYSIVLEEKLRLAITALKFYGNKENYCQDKKVLNFSQRVSDTYYNKEEDVYYGGRRAKQALELLLPDVDVEEKE